MMDGTNENLTGRYQCNSAGHPEQLLDQLVQRLEDDGFRILSKVSFQIRPAVAGHPQRRYILVRFVFPRERSTALLLQRFRDAIGCSALITETIPGFCRVEICISERHLTSPESGEVAQRLARLMPPAPPSESLQEAA